MAKKSTATSQAAKLAGKTVAFVGKFGYGGHDLDAMLPLVATEGGSVVDGVKTAPDYLVAGDGVGGNPPAAVAKIQKKHPQVQLLDQAGFYQLVNPTAEEFRALIKSGPHGHEFWDKMQDQFWRAGQRLDLTGADFRKQTIEGTLYKVCLDDSDFRGAKISAYFDEIRGANFDGATFKDGSFSNAHNCSLKQVTMNDVRWNPAVFANCDFSGARLAIETGSHTTANGCTFEKADFHEAELEHSKFIDCDFRGANLQGAQLEACEFTGSNLSGANLTRADLRKAKFTNADLRNALFQEAMLSGADFTGAQIDGADFTGANVTDAILSGLDLSLAKNLAPKAARPPGPNLLELGKTARASKKFEMSIEFALGPDESVTLSPSLQHFGTQSYAWAGYCHHKPNHNFSTSLPAPTFEQGVLDLTDLWSRGTPQFDTVKVNAQKCPLRGKELHDLVSAAWYEACGLPVPTADEFAEQQKQAATETAALRETMLAELHGGPAGVKKWNSRSDKDREKLGKLRKHDFAGSKLAGAYLSNQNFEGSNFAGANLQKALFCNAELKGVNFADADLAGANLAGSKPADVSFEAATLAKCNLRNAGFRRCNFKNADLSQSDFSFSDICGSDFTGAILAGVEYFRTRFDEKTSFPEGYVPPEALEWKGVGPRPGAAPPPPPPKSGTRDFESFLEQLNNKVEQARMQKAGSMLKAERFQLFADVKDDALTGIVKSQTDKDLVYSCRLAADGAFGCCTQNLRPCGGLRGALCKHLLVLIIGLAKAGQLDAATVDHWIELSKSRKPAIDEDSMSATFLRYKGAEAGEVDWRPTETIPEDFYAM
jgi:uncharacterized protein YjbI with pentapeptide repeats